MAVDTSVHLFVRHYTSARGQREEDCRPAVLDETEQLESEFGREIVEPFYRLLWLFNNRAEVMTSHTAVRKKAPYKPRDRGANEFAWARECVGVYCNIFPRVEADRLSIGTNQRFAQQLHEELRGAAQIQRPDTKGWYMHIWPERFDYQCASGLADIAGYGVELKMLGYAGNRRRAAERWEALVGFVVSAVERINPKPVLSHP